jgi:hypothetical protein
MEYHTNDKVLPILKLPDPCPISLSLDDDAYIHLSIGPRDITFNRKSGKVAGSGCFLGNQDESEKLLLRRRLKNKLMEI